MPISVINNDSIADTAVHGQRNLIINGAMQVWQRATAATTAINDAYSTLDRFKFFESSDGAYTTERSTTAPSSEGFTYSLKAVVTTADASIAAAQYAAISQYIEAQNLQHLGYGTSSAKSLTLSFWVRSNKTGTYTIALEKSDSTLYRYVKEYSISTADTWEKKTITIEPDSQIRASAGAIDNDSGYGIRVFWNLVWGSTFNGATDATWSSDANDYATSNQVNWLDTIGNDFYITGVQLEVGETATPFEHRSYGDELARCHRYYEKATGGNTAGTTCDATSGVNYHVPFKHATEMRATPTYTWTEWTSSGFPATAATFQQSGKNGVNVYKTCNSTGSGKFWLGYVTADAEL